MLETLCTDFLTPHAVELTCRYSPNMVEETPRWVYANAGFSLLFYQILDVADGKQARKTGNSSPLGLLFDHGCDALNVVVSACTLRPLSCWGRRTG